MKNNRRAIFCVFVLIGACCLGCGGEEGETRTVNAHIMGFKVHIIEEHPALVIVEYIGDIGGCDSVHDPKLERLGENSFHIQVLYDVVSGATCADYLDYYDRQVILGRLYPGHYTVTINDDHVMQFEVPPDPKCQTIVWGSCK